MLNLNEAALRHGAQKIKIHDWDGASMIEVKAKRPALYNMAAMGCIPNPILGAMQKMFSGNSADVNGLDARRQGECVIAMAKYALVEPTYQEIVDAGLELTDQQLMDLYQFALVGPARYAAFRAAMDGAAGEHGDAVQGATEQPDGD